MTLYDIIAINKKKLGHSVFNEFYAVENESERREKWPCLLKLYEMI